MTVRATFSLRTGHLSWALRCVIPAVAARVWDSGGPSVVEGRGGRLQVRQHGALCDVGRTQPVTRKFREAPVPSAPVGDSGGSFPVRTLLCSTGEVPFFVPVLCLEVSLAQGCDR